MKFGRELNLELFAKGAKFGVSSLLGLQIWESPFGDFCLFSVAFTTPRTALSLDRWLLTPDKLFITVGNDFFKLDLLLDSKEFSAFLRIGKHFVKMIRRHNLDEKRVCKIGKPRLFTFRVVEPRVGRASFKPLSSNQVARGQETP